jgi:Glycosyltransferase family 87
VRRFVLAGLFAFVAGFAVFALSHIFPPEPYGLADDWRVFYAAATLAQHGGNPYSTAAIHAAEQAAQHYGTVQPSLDDFTDLPIVAWLLRAFTWLPYWWSFAVFTALGAAAAAAALHAWARAEGWTSRATWLVAAMCSWPMLLGFFSGQFDALLLAAVVAALLLMRRGSPWLAGVCMLAVAFKPHLLWPVPLLILAVWAADRPRAWRFGVSAVGTVGAAAVAGFLLVPGAGSFVAHALGFGGRVAAVQPDLSGIPGFLASLRGGGIAGDAVAVLGAAAVIALAWLSARNPRLRALPDAQRAVIPLTGLAVWLACTPYAHPNDDVLLYPLIALVIGAQGSRLDARSLQLAVVACLAVVSAFLVAPALGYAVVLAAIAFAVARRNRMTTHGVAAFALVAVALLPTVWPFHVLAVPVTPLAVALIALAGAMETSGLLAAGGKLEWRRGLLRVVVEPAPALAAAPPRGDHALEDRNGRGVRPVAGAL